MNMFLRSFILSCACFGAVHVLGSAIVLQKEINLGKDPKTNKTIVIKAFALVNSGEKENADTRWYSVFPLENELAFFCTQSGQSDAFPITHLLKTEKITTVEFDLADKEIKTTVVEAGKKAKSLFTMQLTVSRDIETFKEFVVLLAKADQKGLQAFVNKHTIEKIEEIANNAIVSRGECFITADDKEKYDDIVAGKIKVTGPTQLKGQYVFLPAREILEALIAEAAALEAQNKSGQ